MTQSTSKPKHTLEHKRRFVVEVTLHEHTHLTDSNLGNTLITELTRSSLTYHLSNASRIRIIGEENNGN